MVPSLGTVENGNTILPGVDLYVVDKSARCFIPLDRIDSFLLTLSEINLPTMGMNLVTSYLMSKTYKSTQALDQNSIEEQ